MLRLSLPASPDEASSVDGRRLAVVEDLDDASGRCCDWCGERIPKGARSDAQTCSTRCRQARHRFRVAVGSRAGDAIADLSPSAARRFPSADLVAAAAAMWGRETYPDRYVTVQVGDRAIEAQQRGRVDHFGRTGEVRPWLGEYLGATVQERQEVEGPRWYLEVGPGVVAFGRRDPARRQRGALEREHEAREARHRQLVARELAGDGPEPEGGVDRVRSWSRKSRARMTRRLAELDYAPLFDQGDPTMVTLTLPGDWLTVAPSARVARRMIDRWRKRFERDWDRPLIGVWKREFQERGAPHWHIFMVAPTGTTRAGETFQEWLSRSWAEVVGAASCGAPDAVWGVSAAGHPGIICCERHRHLAAGTGIDDAEGARAADPRRLAVYFSKHGSFAAKDRQNDAPWEWLHEPECADRGCEGCADEGIGRFWGVWRLRRAVASVEIAEDRAAAARRTASRWASANGYYTRVKRWRKVTTVDRETGEIGFRWRRRSTRVRVRRLTGPAGYLVVNDGPGFAAQLARAADLAVIPRSGPPPGRFLP